MADQARSGFSKVLAVAWREFRHTVLTKAFLLGAVVLPLVATSAVALVPLFLRTNTAPIVGTLIVVDPSGLVAKAAAPRLQRPDPAASASATPPGLPTDPVAAAAAAGDGKPPPGLMGWDREVRVTVQNEPDPARVEALKARLGQDGVLGIAVVPPGLLEKPGAAAATDNRDFELLVPSSSPPQVTETLERAVRDAIVEARVARSGQDYAALKALLERPNPQSMRVSQDGRQAPESRVAKMLIPAGFMFLLWVSVFTSANYLLTTTIEEKGSKVMEVLLSALSPMQLLGGKLLGQAGVSAVMLLMYGGLALVGLNVGRMGDVVPAMHFVWAGVFFVMAYCMVATLMVAVGSAVSDLREAQSLVGPVMLLLMLPLMLWFAIVEHPNGTLAVVTSFTPPAIPFVMILRLTTASEPVPHWQVAASIVVGFASAFGMLWAASRIFRVGILLQGKPPSLRELLRWVRYR